MLRSIIAAIAVFIASIFGGHPTQLPANVQSQPAAAVVAFSESADPFSTSTSTGVGTTPPSGTAAQTVNYITAPMIERVVSSDPLAAADFVTQDELDSQLLQLTTSLTQKFTAPATASIPQYVAADGNSAFPYAAENSINNLSNVTITGATITNSSVNGGGGSGSSTVDSGTQGEFAFYDAPGTTLTATSSIFLAQSGDVLIGTTTDSFATLFVQGFAESFLDPTGTNAITFIPSSDPTGFNSIYSDYFTGTTSESLGLGTFESQGALIITPAGNVGIGTTTPGSLLSLGGIANFTTATSTFYSTGGIDLTSGCFSINGNCISGGGGSSQWTTSSPNIYFNTGNVGIGTTTPVAALSVSRSSSGELTTNGTFTGSASGWTLGSGWTYGSDEVTHTPGGTEHLQQNIGVQASDTYTVSYDTTGGTQGEICVWLGGQIIDGVGGTDNGTHEENVVAPGTGDLMFDPTCGGDDPTGNFNGAIDNVSVTQVNNVLAVSNDGTHGLFVDSTGDVGIGSPNPGAALDINGNIQIESSGQIIGDGGAIAFGDGGPGGNSLTIGGFGDGVSFSQSDGVGVYSLNSNYNPSSDNIQFQSVPAGPTDVAPILFNAHPNNDPGDPAVRFQDTNSYTGNDIFGVGGGSTYNEFLTVYGNGNVGIGTTTPGSLFSLGGIANFTTATSSFFSTGGINLTNGCFSINGNCITGGGGSSLTAGTDYVPGPVYYANLMGIDCSGNTDSSAALQTAINTVPDGGTLEFPVNCKVLLSATTTITDRVSVTLAAAEPSNNDGGGEIPQFIWNASGGTMFDVEHSDHPTFEGLSFLNGTGASVDTFINFDGNPGAHIGSAGYVDNSTFNEGIGGVSNPNFIAVSISKTATNNQEDYRIDNDTFYCSDQASRVSENGSITNGSPDLNVAPNTPFTSGDVGETIWVSYPGGHGLLRTTIQSFTNSSNVVLAANAQDTETGATVDLGQSYGIGIYLGASQNALQEQFDNNNFTNCDYGIKAVGGNFSASHIGGGYGDYGIFIGGFTAQNDSIDYYQSENDMRGIEVQDGDVAPVTITNARMSNGNQLADGFFKLGSKVVLEDSEVDFSPGANQVLIGDEGQAQLTSIGNEFGKSWSQVGYDLFQIPVTSINDTFDNATTTPADQIFGCWNSGSASCVQINSEFGHIGGTALNVQVSGVFANVATTTGILVSGDVEGVTNFTAIEGVGNDSLFYDNLTNVEAAWAPSGINAGWATATSSAYGFYAAGPSRVYNGTLPNLYGLYIAPQATANVTNAWGIYQAGSSDTNYFAGNTGIGTSSPSSRLTVWGPDTASTSAFAVVNSASTTVFSVFDNGNSTYSGSIFQSSDQRLKTDVLLLDASSSLTAVKALNPVSYLRLDQPGQVENLGFLAQQVERVFPQLVSTTSATTLTPAGTLTLNYEGLIAPIVAAIQELDQQLTNLANTVAGFAQSFTTNELTFNRATGQELCLQQSDGTPVCVTGDQLAAVLVSVKQPSAAGDTSSTQNDGASTTPETPPVIQINGDNPAIVQVGDTYNDLGATITGPTDNLNLGITTYVNGTEMSPIQIDTSAAATATIDYVVTDQNGLTSTSTRTVNIEAGPSIISADAASSTAQ